MWVGEGERKKIIPVKDLPKLWTVITSRCRNILKVMSLNWNEPADFCLPLMLFLSCVFMFFSLPIFIIVVLFCVTIPVCIWHGEILSL